MKTFQEALDTCAIEVPRDDSEAMERGMELTIEHAAKYIDILKEAAQADAIRSIIDSLIYHCEDPETAMFSIFGLGLQIGMEMEKCSQCHQEVGL